MSETRRRAGPDEPAALLVAARLPVDGVSRAIVEHCRSLRAGGWRAVVAAADGPLAGEVRRAGGRLAELALDRDGPWARWWTGRRLAALLRAERVRLVHAHRRAGAALAGAAAARARLPYLVTVHEPGELGPRGGRADPLAGAARIVAVSEHVAELLVQEHGLPVDRVRTIPPGVDLAELDPERVRGPRVAAVAERWGLDLGRRIVLVPGPLVRGHGHLVLIRAMAAVARDDLVAVLVGSEDAEPAYVREIERAVREAGLGGRVRFGSPPDDEPAALQLADVLVLPAIEPLPSGRIVAAAQAMGRPVIVSGLGALPECVQPASTGWIVPAADPGELAWALDRALALDEEVKERLAARARAFAAETFGSERVGRKLLDLYREALRPVAG